MIEILKVTIKNHIPYSASKEIRFCKTEVEAELQEGSKVSDIFAMLDITETAAGLILINGKLAQQESLLEDGDFVLLFPEIVGG